MAVIPEHQNHRVWIPLKTSNIWNIDQRVLEVTRIRAWLDELTDWQPDAYTMQYHHNTQNFGPVVEAWFEQEQHAVACALKWS